MIEISASHADVPESFGQFLRREREVRDITLEEIASYTRIKLRALDAIERDDFASLPPLAFIRAFIRCYADYLGLNVGDVMMRFDAFVQARYPDLTGEVTLIQKKSRPKQKYVLMYLGIGLVLLAAMLIWARGDGSGKKDGNGSGDLVAVNDGSTEEPDGGDTVGGGDPVDISEPSTTDDGATALIEPPDPADHETVELPPFEPSPWSGRSREALGPPREVEDVPVHDGATVEPPVLPSAGPHRVEVKLKANCFTRFIIDNNPSRVIILEPGPPVVFEAEHKLQIELSNPSGVESVIYNGQPLEFNPTCYPWWLYFPPSPNDNPCPHQPR